MSLSPELNPLDDNNDEAEIQINAVSLGLSKLHSAKSML